MNLAAVQKLESKHLVNTYDRMPALMVRGSGVYLYDDRGKKYLDLLSGIGVNALGYGHPAILRAIMKQSRKLLHTSNLLFHDHQGELAKKLAGISGLDRVFFANSGTEAWEGALKFARAFARAKRSNGHRPKWRVLAMSNSFHGRTYGSLATTWKEKYRKPFAPGMPGVRFVRFNDVADLKKNFDESVCAIALETIQGEGGVDQVSGKFLKYARQLTKKNGALLVLDEIQCGLGRTGKYFAYQHYGVMPDVVAVAKPLAAGLPLGAVLTTHAVARAISPGMHGSTFGGGPLACAVALEFLQTLERERLLKNVNEVGGYLRQRLAEMQTVFPCVTAVRGRGLMQAMGLESGTLAKAVVAAMLQEGVIINRTSDKVLRFLPPYTITKKQVGHAMAKLQQVLGKLCDKTPLSVNGRKANH